MIKNLKKYLPVTLKRNIRKFIKHIKYTYRKYLILHYLHSHDEVNIIVGAAETFQQGWFSTNEQWLDVTNAEHWKGIFNGKVCLKNVVAEHVFEHLTYQEAKVALELIYQHMLPNGTVRIAVPDGYHPDPVYIKHVNINGIGDDASDHKQLLNVDVLSQLFESVGFKPEHLEGYKANGDLIHKTIEANKGFIKRSRSNPSVESLGKWNFPDASTSLIVDGLKVVARKKNETIICHKSFR